MSEAMANERQLLVLLVSDHEAAAEALAAYLRRRGLIVVATATSPAAAAAAAELLRPDVALVDGEIAGGWRAVAAALEGRLERPQIAVLSGYWGHDERIAATRSGIGATVLKWVAGPSLAVQLRDLVA